jgi:hypothetical protein
MGTEIGWEITEGWGSQQQFKKTKDGNDILATAM